jgi:hypothetical protein
MEITAVYTNQFKEKLHTSINKSDRAEDERGNIEDKDSNPSIRYTRPTTKVLDNSIPMVLSSVRECHDQARESEAHETLKSHKSPLLFLRGINLSKGRDLLETPVNAESSSG